MVEDTRSIFHGMQVLLQGEWQKEQAVVVENGRITAIIPASMIHHHLPARMHVYPTDYYLIPGLIDLHIHGAKGCDVMDGTPAALATISNALAGEGVTGFLATTMTAETSHLEKVLQMIPSVAPTISGAALLGIHLEGPFIAHEKIGAQAQDFLVEPNVFLFQHWQTLAKECIRKVTLAPELPGALELIAYLHATQVIPSIGHTNATFAETRAAIQAGASQATHLFNAMRGILQREPGATTALLLSEQVEAEIIVDGIHLAPAIVELIYKLKGVERLLLVSDAMRAKCLKDGCYELGGQSVTVQAGRVSLANGTLAGSTLRLPEAIKNMVAFTHCSLAKAIQMATLNPARSLMLEQRKGSIEVSKDADLVVLDPTFKVHLTMREGAVIFQS